MSPVVARIHLRDAKTKFKDNVEITHAKVVYTGLNVRNPYIFVSNKVFMS